MAYAAFLLHVSYIGLFTLVHHRELLGTASELCSLIAVTLLGVYIFAELRPVREASATGFFVASRTECRPGSL